MLGQLNRTLQAPAIQNGITIDRSNFESVAFLVEFGAIAATAVTSIRVQQSDALATGFADIPGASVSVANDDDEGVASIEIESATKRYLRVVVHRATANATIDGGVAVLHRARRLPVIQGSDSIGALVVTPTA